MDTYFVKKKIKVLIVDDSAVVRRILSEGLSKDPDIEIVGTAPDPYVARDKISQLQPDVITLDIEMPRMDGLTFLEKLMAHFPLPVIIISSLSRQGGLTAMKALELGAVDVITKPPADVSTALGEMMIMLTDKIKGAAKAKISGKRITTVAKNEILTSSIKTTDNILALAASTGGTEALVYVLSNLPSNTPATVIVQHMPPYFTSTFAERLNKNSPMEVREAKNGDTLHQGLALLAPGGFHMMLRKSGARFYVEIKDGPLVCRVKPSADVLFKSVAKYAGLNAVGVIMTGMGQDGALGLLEMLNAGASTIGQNEESCIVYGMPKAAVEFGAVQTVSSLENIPKEILKKFQ